MKIKLLIAAIITSCLLSINCSKKKDDPAPAPVIVPKPPTTSNTATNNNLNKDSVTFSVKNSTVVYKFVSLDTLYKGTYFKARLSGGLGGSIIYEFKTKPTANFSYEFGTGTFPYQVEVIHSSFDSWDATSGTINVEVTDSKITMSFTDVIFTNRVDNSTKTCTGYLSTYKWVKP